MNEEQAQSGPPEVRASDTERDAVITRLREAVAEGRVDAEEHTERVNAALSARTRAELDRLVVDLPEPRPDDPPSPIQGMGRLSTAEPTSRQAVSIMSYAEQAGIWTVPKRFTAASLMGHVEIDLREARFTTKHTTIQAHSLMGSVEVIVPDDVKVRVEGVGIMGGYWMDGDPPTSHTEAPIVTVTGVALMGSVWGTHKLREHQKQPKKSWWRRFGTGEK